MFVPFAAVLYGLFTLALCLRGELAERCAHLALAAVAFDCQRDFGAGADTRDRVAKCIRIGDRRSIQRGDDVTLPQPGAIRGTSRLHLVDNDAWSFIN